MNREKTSFLGARAQDPLSGPVFMNMTLMVIPLILSNILQLLFNTADQIVVGRFAGDKCLAAISATAFLTSIFVNLFSGAATGVNVVIARYIGEGRKERIGRAVHTSMTFAFLGGLAVCIFGRAFAAEGLRLTGCPEDVFGLAEVYLKIIFLGVPAQLVYNYGAAILRSRGETKRPLGFLVISGIVNVVLNITMIVVFKRDVDGVAIATVFSHYLSACFMVLLLLGEEGCFRLEPGRLGIDGDILKELLRHGLPAGFQSVMFSIANLALQREINAFGSVTVAANGCAYTLETYTSTILNACTAGMITYVSQNRGAGKKDRIRSSMRAGFLLQGFFCAIFACIGFFLAEPFMRIFTQNPETIQTGMVRIHLSMYFYVLYSFTQAGSGYMRGMGHPNIPTCISLFGIVGTRLLYIFTFYRTMETIGHLYLAFPLSWAVSAALTLFAIISTDTIHNTALRL